KSRDEIGELTLAFNKMNNDIQSNVEQIEHEKNLREQIFTSINEGVLYFDSRVELMYSNKKGNYLYDRMKSEPEKFEDFQNDIREIVEYREPAIERVDINDRHMQFSYTPVEQEDELFGVILMIMYIIEEDRKSTRLNSSHVSISYAVFCL